ncbi:hypothetical protein O53_1345 [Microcystis aeruginosa TAIHU98]|uniref:Uncharacterized protein n=1 Tax=Microcystis aeruginosa TAIHU98 TaxID=1134457 RepID=L7ED02_MICAE|nr:hypothetical protein O53_1345 [Microcystis aeruginosa TAIHU98]
MWGVGKETSFISGGKNFFIGTDSSPNGIFLIFAGDLSS